MICLTLIILSLHYIQLNIDWKRSNHCNYTLHLGFGLYKMSENSEKCTYARSYPSGLSARKQRKALGSQSILRAGCGRWMG